MNVFDNIILNVRMPRTLCSLLIGAGLSICGCAMQGMLKNPLADGTTLGVSSGASVGAILALCIPSIVPVIAVVTGQFLLIVLSIIFSILSFIAIFILSVSLNSRMDNNTIILVGIIFTMFCSSIISIFVTFFPENAKTLMFWMMGSISGVNYIHVLILIISFIVCFTLIYLNSEKLNIISLGDTKASSLGVNVEQTKIIIMLAVSVVVGICVSISGTIAFVGLIVPHFCRKITGHNLKKLTPFTAVFGGWFLLLADFISRTLIYPLELPIGIITSIIGVVVFVLIFFSTKNRRANV